MTLPIKKPSSSFRRTMNGAAMGEVFIPVIRAYLYDPKFPSMQVQIDGWTAKPPDGYFHPSTHPLMDERVLYHYLAEPERLQLEVFDPTSVMAVTQGSFWHEFIQTCGIHAGLLLPNPKPSPKRHIAEWGWEHRETLSRGHSDGLTNPKVFFREEIFEFKSMREPKMRKLPKLPVDHPDLAEAFKVLVPDYYAQAQEYLRISGRDWWRGVILAMEWPYEMREIVIRADPFFQSQIAEKYRRVIQAAADGRPPASCCQDFAGCPARGMCPVAMIR